jgi:hypothetical protein
MSSIASAVQRNQIANVQAIVNAHRTDEDGTIEFIADGARLWLRFTESEVL